MNPSLQKPWCAGILMQRRSLTLDRPVAASAMDALRQLAERLRTRLWLFRRRINYARRRACGATWGDPS